MPPPSTFDFSGPQTTAELTDDDIERLHQKHGIPITETPKVIQISTLAVSQGGRYGSYKRFSISSSGTSIVAATIEPDGVIYGLVLTVLKYRSDFLLKCRRLRPLNDENLPTRFLHTVLTDHSIDIISVKSISLPKIYHKSVIGNNIYYDILNPHAN